MQNLGKVVVLLGGHSSEREVSLMSGEGVLKALREKGVDAHAFDPAREPVEALLQGGYERAFIALHGGAGENGTIQGLLNFLRLPYTGPGVAASAASFDKEVTKTLWRAAGLPVPEGRVMTGDEDDAALEAVIRELGATGLVVKPGRDGSSIGVSKLDRPTTASLREALKLAKSLCDEILVEEYIRGREFTVAVLDGRALPVIEIRAPEGSYDFQNKYYTDVVSYDCPANLSEEESATLRGYCEKAFRAVGARGWSRIDALRRADGRFALLEINTAPGMTPHSLVPMAARAEGMDYGTLCVKLLEGARIDE